MKHTIACPACKGSFEIWTYSIGMSDISEFRCERCPNTLGFVAPYDRPLSSVLLPLCSCGGHFSQQAQHRCPLCNAQLSIECIKSQIDWRGSEDGRPGVSIGTVHRL